MSLKLNEYRQVIKLDEKFIPSKRKSSIEALADILLKELDENAKRRYYMDLLDVTNPRDLIKLLLTIRAPGRVQEELVSLNDAMLQDELKLKKITKADDIPLLGKSLIGLWNGDITCLEVDAIVNAANPQMEGCFVPFHNCIDNVIHNAAGIMLREDCSRIMKMQGCYESTGVAKITRAYNLPSEYVIHTVGPIVNGGHLEKKHEDELAQSYRACLDIAKESGLVKSLAFCSISTGVYGFPFMRAAEIAIKTVKEWLHVNPDSIDYVIFNTYGDEATFIYSKLLNGEDEWHLQK